VGAGLQRHAADAEHGDLAHRSTTQAYLADVHERFGDQAAAKLDLARVLSELGRRDEALVEARDAVAIHEAKGNRPGISEAEAVLDNL
jgi:hypothetical protein